MPNIHLSADQSAKLQILRDPILRCVGKCSDLPAYSVVRHAHPRTMEMVFIVEGEGTTEVDGKKYRIEPGNIILYNPGVIHWETFDRNAATPLFYHLKFDEFAVSGMVDGCLLPNALQPVLSSGEYAAFFHESLKRMFAEWSEQNVGSEQVSDSLLQCLVVLVLRILDTNYTTIEKSKADSLINQIQSYLSTHYTDKISLKDVAREFHINYYYLSHLFQEKLRISPFRYLTELRINQACHLLSNTTFSVGRIASMIGYANQSTFQVQFKKYKGQSPLQYRAYYTRNALISRPIEDDVDNLIMPGPQEAAK